MVEIEREIEGAFDFELGRERTAPLQYSVTWPEEGEAAGIVLVIPGFGADTNADYARNLRRHIVETTGMGAVNVRYHALESRPWNGAKVKVPEREQLFLTIMAGVRGAKTADVTALLNGEAPELAGTVVRAILEPPRDEYQNFGVVQALDHLCVIGDMLECAPPFDRSRIVALGSSHGAYIAHMIAKIAPSTLAAVIDNSSYVQPPMSYLGLGEGGETMIDQKGLKVVANTLSGWSVSHRHAPNFYDRDRDLIRDMGFLPHALAARAGLADAGTQYFMVNSSTDTLSRPEVKQRQQLALVKAGFDAELKLVTEADLDGQLFKTLDHGMDCSIKGLFDREIGRVRSRAVQPDAVQGSVVEYACVDRGYRFTHSAAAPYVTAETYELYPLDGEQKDGRLRGQAA